MNKTSKKANKKINIKQLVNTPYKRIIILIFIIAILLRIIYVLKIDPYKNQHDVGTINSNGGMAYCKYIYDNMSLPNSNSGQFYHPPLHFAISALWMKVGSIFTKDFNTLFNSIKYLTLIYSVITLFLFYKILKELHIKDKFKVYMMAAFSLMPIGIIFAGSYNNDGLTYMLSIWAILELIKWYKKSTFKRILILAVIVGCTVMTKTSGGLLAVPIAYIFIFKLIREIRKKNDKNVLDYIYYYAIFGVVSLSVGLWYHLRNAVKFGQPILYVLDIHNDKLYTGSHSIAERFLPQISEFKSIYANPFGDYNNPAYVIKTFLFGEWKDWNTISNVLYYSAIIITSILVLVAIYAFIRSMFIPSKRNIVWRDAFGLLAIINVISYIKMNLDLPYGCSMDFRYLTLTLFTGIMFIYFVIYNLNRKNKKLANIVLNIVFIMTILVIVITNIIIISTSSASLTTY